MATATDIKIELLSKNKDWAIASGVVWHQGVTPAGDHYRRKYAVAKKEGDNWSYGAFSFWTLDAATICLSRARGIEF